MRVILWSQIRNQKKEIAIYGAASLLMLVLSAITWWPAPKPQAPAPGVTQAANQRSCLGAWSGIRGDFTAFPMGPSIRVTHVMTRDPRRLLGESSLGIALCHSGYRLQSFCMGSACKTPGLSLVLSRRPGLEAPDGD